MEEGVVDFFCVWLNIVNEYSFTSLQEHHFCFLLVWGEGDNFLLTLF